MVYLFDSSGVNQVSGSPKTTNSSGVVSFPGLASGSYNAQVEYTPTGQTPTALELWGMQTYNFVASNGTTAVTFNRMRSIADTRSGAALTLPTSVAAGSTASISLKVYSISGSYNARVSLIVDRDKVSSYDYNIPYTSCTPNTYSNLGSTGTTFVCTTPAISTAGTYYVYYKVETQKSDGSWVASDQNAFGEYFDVISNVVIPSSWGESTTLATYNLFNNMYRIESYLEGNKIIVAKVGANNTTSIVIDETIYNAVIEYHSFINSDSITNIDTSVNMHLGSQDAASSSVAYFEAMKGKETSLTQAQKDIVGAVLYKNLIKFGVLAVGVILTGVAICAVGGPVGWVVGIGTIVIAGGATALAFGEAHDILHTHAAMGGDQYLLDEHTSYFNGLTYLKGDEISRNTRQQYLDAQLLSRQWEQAGTTFEDLEFYTDTTTKVLSAVTVGSVKELALFSTELAFSTGADLTAIPDANLNMEASVIQALIEQSAKNHYSILSELYSKESDIYTRLADSFQDVSQSDRFNRELFDLAMTKKLILENEREIVYSIYRRANWCVINGNNKCKYEFSKDDLAQMKDLWVIRQEKYKRYISGLETFQNQFAYLTGSCTNAYEELGINNYGSIDIKLSVEESHQDIFPGITNSIPIKIKNLSNETISNIVVRVQDGDSSGLEITGCEMISLAPKTTGSLVCLINVPSTFEDSDAKLIINSIVSYTRENIDLERQSKLLFNISPTFGVLEIKPSTLYPVANQTIFISMKLLSKKNVTVNISPTIKFGNLYSQDLDGLSITLTANQPNVANFTWVVPPQNSPRGTYSINVIVNEVNGPKYVYHFPAISYLSPISTGDIQEFDFSNAAIVSPSADDEISRRLQEALNIPPSRFLILEGLTAEQLLPVMQKNNLILVGGDQVNPLVASIVNRGLIPQGLWLQSGNSTIHVIRDPFSPTVQSGNWAIIVAGYDVDDTYSAGFGLLRLKEFEENQCYQLSHTFSGEGQDLSVSPSNSTICQPGYYISGEIIHFTAHPASGNFVSRWEGTMDNSSTSLTNSAIMPATDLVVKVHYLRNPVPTGIYDERNANILYTGSWVAQTVSGNYSNTEKYSTVIGSTASLTFTGETISVLYRGYPNAFGNMEVRIDDAYVDTINQNTPTQTLQNRWNSLNLGMGTHTIELKHLTGMYISLDGFIISGPPTATPTSTLTFTPTLTKTPTNSITPSLTRSPTNTLTATSTWTQTFTPTNSNTPSPTKSSTNTPSPTATWTLTLTPTLTNTKAPSGVGTYDERDVNIVYTGTWASQVVSGNYANSEKYSTVIGSTAGFTFSGNQVTVKFRKAGVFGNMEVWIDDGLVDIVSQTNATTLQNQSWISPVLSAGTHTIVLKHATGTYIALDAIIISGPPTATPSLTSTTTPSLTLTPSLTFTPSLTKSPTNTVSPTNTKAPSGVGTYDERDVNIVYTGTWTAQAVSGNYANTEKYSSVIGSTAGFTFSGNQVTVKFRKAGVFGNMEVWIDDGLVDIVSQTNTSTLQNQSWVSPVLSAGTHTIVLKHATGTYIALDAIIISGPPTATPSFTSTTTPSLTLTPSLTFTPSLTKSPTNTVSPTNTKAPSGVGTYDERDVNIVYTGTWAAQTVSGNYANTEKYSTVIGSTAGFTFSGNQVTVKFRKAGVFGNMEVWIDDGLVDIVSQTNTATIQNQSWTSPTLTNGTHTLVLRHASGIYIALDAIIISGPPTATPSFTSTTTPSLTLTPSLTFTPSLTKSPTNTVSPTNTKAPSGVGTYDERDVNIVYTGSWAAQVVTGNYANTEKYSTVIGSTAGFTFSGNQVTVRFRKAGVFGNMEVWIDSGLAATVSQTNIATIQNQSWTSPTLTNGTHTLVLRHASGIYIALDAIVISEVATLTPTLTFTNTSTFTPTMTFTYTSTFTPTFTSTFTSTTTPTNTLTPSETPSPSPTSTFTDTPTLTPTFTATATVPAIPEPYSYFSLDDKNDSKGFANTTQYGSVSYIPGLVGNALSIPTDMENTYIGLGSGTYKNFLYADGTINVWVNALALNSHTSGAVTIVSGSPHESYACSINHWILGFANIPGNEHDNPVAPGNEKIQFWAGSYSEETVHDPANSVTLDALTGQLLVNQWYMISVTHVSAVNQWNLYVNGDLISSISTPGGIGQGARTIDCPYAIGGAPYLSTYGKGFPGLIDELGFWNVPLSDEQIQYLYQENNPNP